MTIRPKCSFSNMKPIHTDSFHFQTRGVVPQLPSEAQPSTPSGFRERSIQRVKFILEGHGTRRLLEEVGMVYLLSSYFNLTGNSTLWADELFSRKTRSSRWISTFQNRNALAPEPKSVVSLRLGLFRTIRGVWWSVFFYWFCAKVKKFDIFTQNIPNPGILIENSRKHILKKFWNFSLNLKYFDFFQVEPEIKNTGGDTILIRFNHLYWKFYVQRV